MGIAEKQIEEWKNRTNLSNEKIENEQTKNGSTLIYYIIMIVIVIVVGFIGSFIESQMTTIFGGIIPITMCISIIIISLACIVDFAGVKRNNY